jgi:hypothetical protein
VPKPRLIEAPRFTFGTKAETLECLSGELKTAEILPHYYFTFEQWKSDPAQVVARIASQPWSHQDLMVRSSAKTEDASHASAVRRPLMPNRAAAQSEAG